MPNLPTNRFDQLQWFEARITTWTANATSLNLTAGAMTTFAGQITSARTAYDEMMEIRAAAKAATENWYNASTKMVAPGRGHIATIKAFAEASSNPNVWVLSMMDPPAPPSPAVAPSVPANVTGTVSATGLVTVSWNATPSGPTSGIIFIMQRKRQGESGWTVIGATQEKSFIDPSANVAAGNVSYQIRAQRGTLFSEWTVPLTFDIDNSGNFVASFGGGSGESALAA